MVLYLALASKGYLRNRHGLREQELRISENRFQVWILHQHPVLHFFQVIVVLGQIRRSSEVAETEFIFFHLGYAAVAVVEVVQGDLISRENAADMIFDAYILIESRLFLLNKVAFPANIEIA